MRRHRSILGTWSGLMAARLKPKRRCVRPRALIRCSRKLGTIFPDLLDEQGRSEAAIDCLRRALQAAADYADAMFNLALLLQRGSRHKEAAECWRQYLANDAQSELGTTRTSILKILRNANSSVSVLRSSRAALPWTGEMDAKTPRDLALLAVLSLFCAGFAWILVFFALGVAAALEIAWEQ